MVQCKVEMNEVLHELVMGKEVSIAAEACGTRVVDTASRILGSTTLVFRQACSNVVIQ